MFTVTCLAEDASCLWLGLLDNESKLPGRERLWVISDGSKGNGIVDTVVVGVGIIFLAYHSDLRIICGRVERPRQKSAPRSCTTMPRWNSAIRTRLSHASDQLPHEGEHI